MSDKGKRNYEIGYGRPPKRWRFKPGQSGNPRGRPKGAQSLGSRIDDELNKKVVVRENGRTSTLRKQDVMIKAIVNKAIGGDLRSVQFITENSCKLREIAATEPERLSEIEKVIIGTYIASQKSGESK